MGTHTGNSAMGGGAAIVVLMGWLLSPAPDGMGGGAVYAHLLGGITLPDSVTAALLVLVGSLANLAYHRHAAKQAAASASPNIVVTSKGSPS